MKNKPLDQFDAYDYVRRCKQARMKWEHVAKELTRRGVPVMEQLLLGATFYARNKS